MNAYTYIVTAINLKHTSSFTGLMAAANEEEATKELERIRYHYLPPTEGYHSHNISVFQVDPDHLGKVCKFVLGR